MPRYEAHSGFALPHPIERIKYLRNSFIEFTPEYIERRSIGLRGKLSPIVSRVKTLREEIKATEDKMQAKLTERLNLIRDGINQGANPVEFLSDMLACFSVASESRTGKTPWEEQLMGAAIATTEKAIVQMPTGEGKTISIAATATNAAIESLSGKSVHVFSPNDYLAETHCKEFAPVLQDLGVKAAFFRRKDHDKDEYSAFTFDPDTQELREISVRDAYHGGYVIYGSHSSYLHHYLEDRRRSEHNRVQSNFQDSVAIVDEADSILIDAASTQSIIAKNTEMSNDDKTLYNKINRIVQSLTQSVVLNREDFQVVRHGQQTSKKHNNNDAEVVLTEEGRKKIQDYVLKGLLSSVAAENLLGLSSLRRDTDYEIVGESLVTNGDYYFIENGSLFGRPAFTNQGIERIKKISGADIYSEEFSHLKPNFDFALIAKERIKMDEDYIRRDGKIVLIDRTTGRLMPNTHLRLLDQALLAKEGLLTEDAKVIETDITAAVSIQKYFNQYSKVSGFTATATPSAREFNEVYGLDVYEAPSHFGTTRKDYITDIYDGFEEIELIGEESSDEKEVIRIPKNLALAVKLALERREKQPVLLSCLNVDTANTLQKIVFTMSGGAIKPIIYHAGESQDEEEKINQAGKPGTIMIATNIAGRGTDIKAVNGLFVIGTELDRSQRITMQLRGRSGRNGSFGESVFLISNEDPFFDILKLKPTVKDKFDVIFGKDGSDAAIEYLQSVYDQQDYEARRQMLRFEEVIGYKEDGFQKERQSVIDNPEEHLAEIEKIVKERFEELINEERNTSGSSLESVRAKIREIIPQKDILSDADLEKIDLSKTKSRAILQKAIATRANRLILAVGLGRIQLETLLSLDDLWSNYVNVMTDSVLAAIGETARGQNPIDTYRKMSGDLFEIEKRASQRHLADRLIALTPKQISI